MGWAGWSTVYTPVGYILKADNILSHLRKLIHEASTLSSDVTLLENSSVTQIDRSWLMISSFLQRDLGQTAFWGQR